MSRPNILLITADQLRADALGCYGNPVCRTPHLDGLAGRGVCCELGYTPNPICVPARASITTGNYSHKATGNKDNEGLIQPGQARLAEHFASAGYETYACGKLHYVPYAPPGEPRLLHGFANCDLCESGRILAQFDPKARLRGLEDYIDYLADVGWAGYSRAHGIGNNDVRPCVSPLPAGHCVDHWVADRTIQRIEQHVATRADQPFLIWCSFPKPHSPYDPPAAWADLYDPRTVPPPAGDESMLSGRAPQLLRERIGRAQATLSPQARQVIKAYYYGLISFHDAQVGRVMSALAGAGQLDNTIVIYTADHGDLIGDFGTYFKCSFLEGSARVPFLAAGPGIGRGLRTRTLVGLQDVLPTLAALADVPLPGPVDGCNLTAVLNDPAERVRDVFYGQCFNAPEQMAMLFDGRFKYCYAQEGPTEELYDLEADPQELNNLAEKQAGRSVLPRWREYLAAEARRLGDDALLDGDNLAAASLDRESIGRLPIAGMGWRWY